MRILILSNIAPYRIGGAEAQARLLAECFHRRGHAVTVAGYAVPHAAIAVPGKKGRIDAIHLPTIQRNRLTRAFSFFVSLALFLILKGRHYDLIYCRMIGESAIVAAFLKQLGVLRLPLVICSEGSGATGDASFLKSLPASSMIVGWLNRQCQAINVLSPKIRSELRSLGLDQRLFTFIPNGVRIPAGDCIGWRSPSRQRIGLFVGRLVPVKGVAILLHAIRILKNQGVPGVFDIIGDGPLREALEQLSAALGIGSLVKFHGALSPEKVGDAYRSSSFLILPSNCEGFPLVIAEALSFGLPVIVTRSGGPEYLIDDETGLIVPRQNPQALADSIARMLRMPASSLIEMGRNARRRAIQAYDIEHACDLLLSLFERLRPNLRA